jgi:Fe-S-cluster containining protein
MPSSIHYTCQRCTACCRWPGFVKLAGEEIGAIAQFLSLDEHDFIQRYTRLRPNRDGLALIDKPNGECVFLQGRDCAIQAVKPGQCRGFPNAWNFPGWRESCEAVPSLRPETEDIFEVKPALTKAFSGRDGESYG